MSNKLLGTVAMLCAPFLCLDFHFHGNNGNGYEYVHTRLGGVFSFLHIVGWFCSIIGLIRLQATGKSKYGKGVLVVLLCLLIIANAWSFYEIINPGAYTLLYNFLDPFWPLSNLYMLFIGIRVLLAKQLTGWRRYVPLITGLWLPVSFLVQFVVGKGVLFMNISGFYSLVAWTLLGYSIYSSEYKMLPTLKTKLA